MKSFYMAYSTEYEEGWGQRPDGFVIAKTKNDIETHINKIEDMGTMSCFWEYERPFEVFCEDETYEKIIKDMGDNNAVEYSESFLGKINLYKLIK